MTKELKFVFHVEDPATKALVVEKSQVMLRLGTDAAAALTVASLARDHHGDRIAALECVQCDTKRLSDEQREALKTASLEEKAIDEILMAMADIVRRVLRVKLREWARHELEQQ